MKNRGVEDVLIAVIDGLKGFPEAITAVFPQATVQTCSVLLKGSGRLLARSTWLQGSGAPRSPSLAIRRATSQH